MRLRPGERVLFIGDSITDGNRDMHPPHGNEFVAFLDILLAAKYPQLNCQIVNRGIGGDTVVDLARRWEEDALAVDPDWMFVMIGVNDFSFQYMETLAHRAVTPTVYHETYRDLIRQARERTNAKIVLIEPTPFHVPVDLPIHADLREACAIVKQVAEECGVERCLLHDRFRTTMDNTPDGGWMSDHVHPSARGHSIIALTVLEYLGW